MNEKAFKIFKAIGFAPDSRLEEALDYVPPRRRIKIPRPAVRAACAAVALGVLTFAAVALIRPGGGTGPTSDPGGADGTRDAPAESRYPLLPLTAVSAPEGLTASRTVTLDLDGLDEEGVPFRDAYELTNTTGGDLTLRLLYPFIASLSNANPPELTLDGAPPDAALHTGPYAGGFSTGGGVEGMNLWQCSDFAGFAGLLSDGGYQAAALAPAPVTDTPVTVHKFTGTGGFTVTVPDSAGLLTFGFSSTGTAEGGAALGHDGREGGAAYIIATGGDTAVTDTGGAQESVYTGTLYGVLEDLALESIRRYAGSGIPLLSSELDTGAFTAELRRFYAAYGPGGTDPACRRYDNGRLDDLIWDCGVVERVMYLEVPVTLPAGGSATFAASGTLRSGFSYDESGTAALRTFTLATTLGSDIVFASQRAELIGDREGLDTDIPEDGGLTGGAYRADIWK